MFHDSYELDVLVENILAERKLKKKRRAIAVKHKRPRTAIISRAAQRAIRERETYERFCKR